MKPVTEKKPFQNKKLGQVFLKDQNILNKTIEIASITKDDIIVEIGCGEGWLSLRLAERCKHLYILEIDRKFLEITKERLQDFSNVTYLEGDALKTTLKPIQESRFKVVANIPYQISAPLTKLFITEKDRLEFALILVQDEFAKKLASKPGQSLYTSFSIYTQFHFETSYCFFVSRQCFRPVPKVDSAVIKLVPRKEPLFQVNEEDFFNMVRSVFWGRRKTIGSCLGNSPYLNLEKTFKIDVLLSDFLQKRGETLSMEDFYVLYTRLKPYFP